MLLIVYKGFGGIMNKIEHAKTLMKFVHYNQLRRDLEPYCRHSLRVAGEVERRGGNEDMIITSLLHDTIEDSNSPYHISCLIEDVFGKHVHDLVNILTHLSKTYTYNEYILNVSKNPEALQIKWADMIDNTHHPIPEKQWLKYRRVCILLREKGIEIPKILQERLRI